MPLPLTVSCSSKIQIDFAFLFAFFAQLGSPGKWLLNYCVCYLLALISAVSAGDWQVAAGDPVHQ